MPEALRDHPLRRQLTHEVHTRPFARLTAPQRATHLALLSGEAGAAADHEHVARLCAVFGVAPPDDGETHFMADFGEFRLKWERHTEFSTYSFFCPGNSQPQPFAQPVLDRVPRDWLEALPGELLVGIHAELEPAEQPDRDPRELAALFAGENFTGSEVVGDSAAAWMDFAINPDGFGRLLISDRQLRPLQAGRLVQRLFEIETYRMMALLAFPLAKRYGPELGVAVARLAEITQRMAESETPHEERRLLDELTALSQEIERLASATGYRFSAAEAYHAIVRERIEELRESRIEGFQTIDEFMARRLAPAMRTCAAVRDRLDRLSRRVARASQLLLTRVDIHLEAQNRDLLRSMNRRAKLQLRLQETVEGLSVAAISYYLVGLINYAAKAVKAGGLAFDVDLVTGLSIPVVALLVWYGVRRVRRMVTGRAGADEA